MREVKDNSQKLGPVITTGLKLAHWRILPLQPHLYRVQTFVQQKGLITPLILQMLF